MSTIPVKSASMIGIDLNISAAATTRAMPAEIIRYRPRLISLPVRSSLCRISAGFGIRVEAKLSTRLARAAISLRIWAWALAAKAPPSP